MTLTSLWIAPLLAACVDGDEVAAFAPPVQLETSGPEFSRMIYPTPVLHDVDGDGRRELVLGDLIGNLFVCEPNQDGSWAGREPMQVEGEPLRLDNW